MRLWCVRDSGNGQSRSSCCSVTHKIHPPRVRRRRPPPTDTLHTLAHTFNTHMYSLHTLVDGSPHIHTYTHTYRMLPAHSPLIRSYLNRTERERDKNNNNKMRRYKIVFADPDVTRRCCCWPIDDGCGTMIMTTMIIMMSARKQTHRCPFPPISTHQPSCQSQVLCCCYGETVSIR